MSKTASWCRWKIWVDGASWPISDTVISLWCPLTRQMYWIDSPIWQIRDSSSLEVDLSFGVSTNKRYWVRMTSRLKLVWKMPLWQSLQSRNLAQKHNASRSTIQMPKCLFSLVTLGNCAVLLQSPSMTGYHTCWSSKAKTTTSLPRSALANSSVGWPQLKTHNRHGRSKKTSSSRHLWCSVGRIWQRWSWRGRLGRREVVCRWWWSEIWSRLLERVSTRSHQHTTSTIFASPTSAISLAKAAWIVKQAPLPNHRS